MNVVDGTFDGCVNRRFHLHRFEHNQLLAGFDFVTNFNGDVDHHPWHARADLRIIGWPFESLRHLDSSRYAGHQFLAHARHAEGFAELSGSGQELIFFFVKGFVSIEQDLRNLFGGNIDSNAAKLFQQSVLGDVVLLDLRLGLILVNVAHRQ